MAYYRLYFLDCHDHIRSFDFLEAENDASAIAMAEARDTPFIKELWCEDRRVLQWQRAPRGAALEKTVMSDGDGVEIVTNRAVEAITRGERTSRK